LVLIVQILNIADLIFHFLSWCRSKRHPARLPQFLVAFVLALRKCADQISSLVFVKVIRANRLDINTVVALVWLVYLVFIVLSSYLFKEQLSIFDHYISYRFLLLAEALLISYELVCSWQLLFARVNVVCVVVLVSVLDVGVLDSRLLAVTMAVTAVELWSLTTVWQERVSLWGAVSINLLEGKDQIWSFGLRCDLVCLLILYSSKRFYLLWRSLFGVADTFLQIDHIVVLEKVLESLYRRVNVSVRLFFQACWRVHKVVQVVSCANIESRDALRPLSLQLIIA